MILLFFIPSALPAPVPIRAPLGKRVFGSVLVAAS